MTISLTIDQARDIIDRHLDNNRAESTDSELVGFTEAEIDIALQGSLDQCLIEYTKAGGDNFREHISSTTDSSGQVDLSSYDPIDLVGAAIYQGNVYEQISRIGRRDRHYDNGGTGVTVEIELVRRRTIPTTDGHPLVGDGATAANSFPAFDRWVAARAAQSLNVRDAEMHQTLMMQIIDLKSSCMLMVQRRARNIPTPPRYQGLWYKWSWTNSNQYFNLHRSNAWGL